MYLLRHGSLIKGCFEHFVQEIFNQSVLEFGEKQLRELEVRFFIFLLLFQSCHSSSSIHESYSHIVEKINGAPNFETFYMYRTEEANSDYLQTSFIKGNTEMMDYKIRWTLEKHILSSMGPTGVPLKINLHLMYLWKVKRESMDHRL